MAEYSFFDKFHAEKRVTFENTEILKPYVAHQKPVIFVIVHTGNWEIFGKYVTDYGIDLMCLYKPVKNRFSRRIGDIARARMGGVIKLVDADDPSAMRQICKHLANKGHCGLSLMNISTVKSMDHGLGDPCRSIILVPLLLCAWDNAMEPR